MKRLFYLTFLITLTNLSNCMDLESQHEKNSLLQNAIHRQNLPRVKQALAAGADANYTPEEGSTMLSWAIAFDTPPQGIQIIQELLKSGADVNKKNLDFHNFPLHTAARFGDVQAAQLLLDAGADINQPDDALGTTPLYDAALQAGRKTPEREQEIIYFLLENGADPQLPVSDITILKLIRAANPTAANIIENYYKGKLD